ncbi:hypothetical protein [Microbulbifer sp. Q7]|uniref:hypothetical protein n=1 Tax=Microbulbifer sp. Q7 TaxID=1785091 RepID=UPI000ABFD4CE|nr:hypothetical protein [Microbulbifer sp. Q7]
MSVPLLLELLDPPPELLLELDELEDELEEELEDELEDELEVGASGSACSAGPDSPLQPAIMTVRVPAKKNRRRIGFDTA